VVSKSDIVILVVASSALAVGIVRWYQNTQDISTITVPANSVSQSVQSSTPTVSNNNVLNTTTATVQPEPAIVQEAVVEPILEPIVDVPTTPTVTLGSHSVVSGDYLGKIARQYGTDVQTLRDLNGISGSVIQIGQEILYPL